MPPRTRKVVGLAAALAVLSAGLILARSPDAAEPVPFGPDAVHAVLTMQLLDPPDPYPFDIPDLRSARSRFQTFQADLAWVPPAGYDATTGRGRFSIRVASKRADLPAPRVWANAPSGAPVLYGIAYDRVPVGFSLSGPEYRMATATSTSPSAGRLTLVIGFRTAQAVRPARMTDLLVTLAFISPRGSLYWIQHLYG